MEQQSDQSSSAAGAPAAVRAVRLPTQLTDLDLLIPYALIAEITDVALPDGSIQLGRSEATMVDWRGQRIPLVSLEAMNGEAVPTIGHRVRCAVLYGTDPERALPYYALLLFGGAALGADRGQPDGVGRPTGQSAVEGGCAHGRAVDGHTGHPCGRGTHRPDAAQAGRIDGLNPLPLRSAKEKPRPPCGEPGFSLLLARNQPCRA